MIRRIVLLTAVVLLLVFMGADRTLAQGLVPEPCTPGEGDCPYVEAEVGRYGTCEFVELINNVISFLITFASIAATLLIMYGGFKLVTSGGNMSAKQEAKSIITNVLIGYVLILAAFLIVNTVLGLLLPGDSRVLSWQRIECLYPTVPEWRGYNEYTPEDAALAIGDGAGSAMGLSQFYNEGVCDQEFLQTHFEDQAAVAACVANGESTCGASLVSRTDLAANGRDAFSFGAFQINISVHEVQGCAGLGTDSNYLDCRSAFRGTNYSSVVEDRALYNECARALANPTCSAINASRLQQRDGWGIWSAYSANNCG